MLTAKTVFILGAGIEGDGMEIDQSIIQLGTELDEWSKQNSATFASEDRAVRERHSFADLS